MTAASSGNSGNGVHKSKDDVGFVEPLKSMEPFDSVFLNSMSYYTDMNPD